MADYSLPPVTDLDSAKTLVQYMHDEFITMSNQLGFEGGNENLSKSTAYSYAAQRMRDLMFQFPAPEAMHKRLAWQAAGHLPWCPPEGHEGAHPAHPIDCPRHGGPWGEDITCPMCTDQQGAPRPVFIGSDPDADLG